MKTTSEVKNLSLTMPLDKCVLRCDRYMRLVIGGTYGYTRGSGKQFHGGIDLYAIEGTDCYSIFTGSVEWVHDFGSSGWGKTVLTRVKFPALTCWALYAHLSTIFVKPGSRLSPRTVIGRTGITGNSDSRYPHLHFEIWKSIEAGKQGTKEKFRLDPLDILGPLPFQPFATDVIERDQQKKRLLEQTA
jgi:murein DD-endopeptidase MepM/ murein hydrolase activator NlpD